MHRFSRVLPFLFFFTPSLLFAQSARTFGQAIEFDSTGELRAKMINRGDTAFTVECWVKSECAKQSAFIFSFASDDTLLSYGLLMHDGATTKPGDRVSISLRSPTRYLSDNSVTGSSARIVPGRWTHLALVRSGRCWRYYQNGELIGYYSAEISVGAWQLLLGRHFVGKIAELRIWNCARTQDSIRARMHTPVSTADSLVEIYYDMRSHAPKDSRIQNDSRLAGADSLDARMNGRVWIDTTNDRPEAYSRTLSFVANMPKPYQFFARNERDSAILQITCSIYSRVDSAIFEVERNDSLISRQSNFVSYGGFNTGFSAITQFRVPLHAECSQYTLRLRLCQGDSIWTVREIPDIVVGDAFLVIGQSNSHPADTEIMEQSPFSRTLGYQTGNQNLVDYDRADTIWGLANAHGFGGALCGPFLTGVWGYYLQKHLMADEHIPICVLNGGAGNSTIEMNLPIADSTDLKTIFGRTLYRSRKAGLDDKFKAIFWYQGESNTIKNYYSNFQQLYSAWRSVFPNVKKYYVYQVRPGWCGAGITSALRDLQRTLADSLPHVRVLSTASLPGHLGCHFTAQGYNAVGAEVLPWVEHDFYGATDTVGASAPMIVRAQYTSTAQNRIALTFDTLTFGLHIIGDTLQNRHESMKDYFYFDSTRAKITSMQISNDTVYLNLSTSSGARAITYLPEQFFNNTTISYEGPTIVNARGIGAFTFDHFPIDAPAMPRGGIIGDPIETPLKVYPNPVAESAHITFSLSSDASVTLTVFDELGRTVATLLNGYLSAGTHEIEWLPGTQNHFGGPCFLKLTAGSQRQMVKVLQR